MKIQTFLKFCFAVLGGYVVVEMVNRALSVETRKRSIAQMQTSGDDILKNLLPNSNIALHLPFRHVQNAMQVVQDWNRSQKLVHDLNRVEEEASQTEERVSQLSKLHDEVKDVVRSLQHPKEASKNEQQADDSSHDPSDIPPPKKIKTDMSND